VSLGACLEGALFFPLPVCGGHVKKTTAWIFPSYFQLYCLLEETCFQQAGSSAVDGTSQAVLDSFDQWKVPAGLSLFLKSGNIPALLYLRKGPEYMPSTIFNLFGRHTRLGTI
jgi:hypothetical protein